MFNRCQAGVLVAVWALGVSISGAQTVQTAPATTAPSSFVVATSKDVPQVAIDAIEAQFSPTEQPSSRTEADKILITHMEKALELGQAAEAQYPDASNLYVVRQMMLSAAKELAGLQRTLERQRQVVEIARRIMNSTAPAAEKLQADFFLLREKILQAIRRPPDQPRPDLSTDLRAFLSRYEDTPAIGRAVAYSVILADAAGLAALKEELLDRLEKDFGQVEELIPFLQHYGRGPAVAPPPSQKTFSAQLTRLDGKKLNVPEDLADKVIVIDFWATWCGPCVAEIPHMKQVYQQFHSRGVEFVGISLDNDPRAREKVQKFIKERGLNWVHTVSGKGWEDPTARKYGIDGIPSIWVIDGKGRIISDNARGNLENVLEEALSRRASPPPASQASQAP
jgi:thiol-disulfide isomerase/thioredoxin